MKKNKKSSRKWSSTIKKINKRIEKAHKLVDLISENDELTDKIFKAFSPNPKLLILLQECKIALGVWKDEPTNKELGKEAAEELIKKIEEVL